MPIRMFISACAAATAVLFSMFPAHAAPLEDCAAAAAPIACLDAKLKEANRRLNDALKQAHQRIEKLQGQGRRSVQTAFVNSQRTFNAYRDAQCGWQAIRAEPGASGATLVKACQIVATLARAEDLEAFARGEDEPVVAAASPAPTPEQPAPEAIADGQPDPVPADAAGSASAAAGRDAAPARPEAASGDEFTPAPPANSPPGGTEWRLAEWSVDGSARELVPESEITVAFDPSGKLAGNASVNRYHGRFGFDADGRLQWRGQGFAVTRMAGPAPLMTQERAFLETLRRMVEYGVEDGRLVLKSASGRTVLTFAR